MILRHVLAATDESEAGRQAVKTATDLATRASARLTILRVLAVQATRRLVSVSGGPSRVTTGLNGAPVAHLRRWL